MHYIDFNQREREEMCNFTQASVVMDGVWVSNGDGFRAPVTFSWRPFYSCQTIVAWEPRRCASVPE